MKHYRRGLTQRLATSALLGMVRAGVTAPLAWAARHVDTARRFW
jgi:hypothetical protein